MPADPQVAFGAVFGDGADQEQYLVDEFGAGAHVEQLGRRGIMGSAHGVGAHLLENLELTLDCAPVYYSAQRACVAIFASVTWPSLIVHTVPPKLTTMST